MNLRGQPSPGAAQPFVVPMMSGPTPPTGDPRRLLSCPGRVLVRPADRRVHPRHRPVETALDIGVGLDGPQDPVPRAVRRPPAMPVMHRLPVAEPHRQVRHEMPVRCRKRMPLITARWLFHRPPRPAFLGRCGSSRAHSASVRSPRPTRHGTIHQSGRHATPRTGPSRALAGDPRDVRRSLSD